MRIVAPLAAVLLLAGCGAGMRTTTTTVERPQPSSTPGPQDARYFGQVVSVTKADPRPA